MVKIPSTRLVALFLAAVVVPACHDGGGVRRTTPPGGFGSAFTLKAVSLSGAQEAPPIVSSATGNGTVDIDSSRTTITATLNVTGLNNITAAHLHVGPLGVDGPIIFLLSAGTFTSPLVVTLTSADLVPSPAQGINTFADAVAALEAGEMYFNVHTAAFPDGEIRGQVGPVALSATLDGAQEAPLVTTSGSGTSTLTFNRDQSAFTVELNASSLVNVTAAHVHAAPPGVDGPIIFSLADGPYALPLTVSVSSLNFTPQPGAGISTYEQAVNAILSGNAYVNVHTVANPDGEIRGRLR